MAVVVAQLVERSHPTPEVRGSNPVIGKFYQTYILSTVLKRRKLKKQRPGMAHSKNNKLFLSTYFTLSC